jgi:type I restriction enzyme M protein
MKALTNNIVGYDISPDMRKLALVNLYLHRFTDPKIYEYDTLTSEERWGDRFDVILANPPFMTPKGGIIPHNKFSMKANRAEVLFVDYIMEHLTLNGRAGVIVPEGIIFQSATAHKALRKLLVDENYLYAVVSLPGGVFNPYAGVKTSILFMDKQIAKRSKDILFVKIDNDGFDLGAQRRPINANDLPEAVQIIENWKAGKDITAAPNASVVSKEAIKGDGDYNLTAGRYIASEAFENCKYAMVKLGEVCEFKRGESITKKDITDGTIPVIAGGQTPAYYHNKANRTGEIITVSASGAYSGFVSFYDIPIFVSDAFTIKPSTESLNIRYLYSLLKGKQQLIYSFQAGGGIPHVHAKDLVNLEIPLPPLEVQKKIVDEIENKQSAINHARQIIENLERERHYLAGLLDGIEYQEVALGDIAKVQYGFTDTAKDEGDARFIRITDIDEDGSLRNSDAKYITLNDNNRKYLLKDGDILVARTGATYGKTLLFKGNASSIYASFLIKLDFDNAKILNTYYWCFAQSKLYWEQAQNLASGGGQPQFNGNAMVNIRIPLPSLADQEKIVAAMEEEQAIITANKSLIDLMDKKIHNVIQRIYKTE